MAREVDAQKRKEDPTFQGAFHERKREKEKREKRESRMKKKKKG
jgi:ATP-dependent RNA helicase RhlE